MAGAPGAVFSTRTPPAHVGLVDAEMKYLTAHGGGVKGAAVTLARTVQTDPGAVHPGAETAR